MRGRGIATILRVRKAAHPRTRLFTRQTRAILSQCIVSASFKGAVRRTLRTKHSRQRTEKNRDSFKLRSISKTMARRWEAAGRQQRPRGALLAMLTAQNIGRAKGRGDDCDEPLKPRTTQPRRRGSALQALAIEPLGSVKTNYVRARTPGLVPHAPEFLQRGIALPRRVSSEEALTNRSTTRASRN